MTGKNYDPLKAHQIFNLYRIAGWTGINKDKLYTNSNGKSKKMNLTSDEKNQIKAIIVEAQQDYFDILGE